MSSQVRQIKRQFRDLTRRTARRRMRSALNEHFSNGTLPASGPARAHITMLQKFIVMADESVGGGGYREARVDYESARRQYQHACREAVV